MEAKEHLPQGYRDAGPWIPYIALPDHGPLTSLKQINAIALPLGDCTQQG
jgi:hypothetical protein